MYAKGSKSDPQISSPVSRRRRAAMGLSKSYISELRASEATHLDVLQRYAEAFKLPLSSLVLFADRTDGATCQNGCPFAAGKVSKMLDGSAIRRMKMKRPPSHATQDCWLYAVASPKDLARRLSVGDTEISIEMLDALRVNDGLIKFFPKKTNGKNAHDRRAVRQASMASSAHSRTTVTGCGPRISPLRCRGSIVLSNAMAHDPDSLWSKLT